jgi:undecaprenyl-diphosphatase
VGDPGATGAVRLFSDWVWDPWTMRAVLAVTAGVLVWRGARGEAVLVAVAAVAGGAVSQAVKAAVGRPRPVWTDPVDTAPYAAFPSGHALGVAVCGGLLLWLLRRRGVRGAAWGGAVAVAVVSAVGVGATRVWLGVHWPSDVLGGWLLGGVVVTGTVTAYHLLAGRAARSPGTPRTPG